MGLSYLVWNSLNTNFRIIGGCSWRAAPPSTMLCIVVMHGTVCRPLLRQGRCRSQSSSQLSQWSQYLQCREYRPYHNNFS